MINGELSRAWLTPAGARLSGPADMATALAVTPSAVSNYLKRGTGPLPAPVATRAGRDGPVPLWTGAQVASAVAAARLELEGRLRELERKRRQLERTGVSYRRRLAVLERFTLEGYTPRHGTGDSDSVHT